MQKNKASEKSDIDLMISDEAKGFDFIDLQENLHQVLHKNIDLIRIDDLKNNKEFLNEVLATGVKIYRNKHKWQTTSRKNTYVCWWNYQKRFTRTLKKY